MGAVVAVEGVEKFKSLTPEPALQKHCDEMAKNDPDMMPYFVLQHDDYIKLKETATSHILSGAAGAPPAWPPSTSPSRPCASPSTSRPTCRRPSPSRARATSSRKRSVIVKLGRGLRSDAHRVVFTQWRDALSVQK